MGAPTLCTGLVLILINCILLAGGVLVLYGSLHAKDSGWIDVVESYWSGADSILTALEVVGGVIIGIAVLGSIAALCRWRAGLLVYTLIVLLVLLVFVVVAVFAFGVRGKSNDWKAVAYPADSDEASIKPEFDRVYCYAQGAYICNQMNVTEAASIFFPTVANSSLLAAFSSLKGVNSMCDALLSTIPSLESVCTGCEQAKQVENFTSVLDWANDKCPRNSDTLLWCGTFLGTGNSSSITVGTAPYTECRPEFLDLISSSALTLGAGSAVICGGALLVIVFSCFLRRRERRETRYENVAYAGNDQFGTPQTGNPYNTPQTAQPFYGNQQQQQRSTDLYGKV